MSPSPSIDGQKPNSVEIFMEQHRAIFLNFHTFFFIFLIVIIIFYK